ncbi:hypothetical protein AFK68_24250 [Hydrocoleum sp. CS-953]|uniref:hypothetical protein n=1 Tax=Hydrocoleum sp. CS-953 TaxID=1671698 RepID=UPI000B9B63EE|nr:hypothetical protein [Hydrocoleum sp. CS-953]OZH52449.1 hypothetical protein AFK68_24250 [Hydrocoleum sp. CS-953]
MAYWNLNNIETKLEPHIKEIYKYTFTNLSGINEVLFLSVFQGVGRQIVVSFNQPKIESLLSIGLFASDLETITLLEGGKSLVLWKYAISISRLKQQANFVSFNELNNLFHYIKNDYSYYLSDQSIVNKDIFIQDGAGELRQEVINQRDYHAVPSYIPNYFTEVTLLYSTREIPIYIPRSFLSTIPQPLTCLLEALPLYVWIIQKNQEEVNNLYREFLVAIAYWLWQFNPSLNPIIQSLVSQYRVIIIQLSLPSSKTWFEANKRQNFSEDITPINITVDTSSGTINVTILPEASRNFLQVDNSAEREMMKYILTGFRELLPEQEQENLSDEIISKIIEIHPPLGLKKQIIYLDSSINPELDPKKLPAYQKVQKADINKLLDDLGDYLNSVKKYPQGKIPENERTKFLNNEVFGFFYSKLKKLVASLNPENLLENLISYHEAIVHQVNEHRLTIPTRLACFSSIPERYKNIQKEMLENNQTALASRFIIEYVVAQPPTGIRAFSLSIYDRLPNN